MPTYSTTYIKTLIKLRSITLFYNIFLVWKSFLEVVQLFSFFRMQRAQVGVKNSGWNTYCHRSLSSWEPWPWLASPSSRGYPAWERKQRYSKANRRSSEVCHKSLFLYLWWTFKEGTCLAFMCFRHFLGLDFRGEGDKFLSQMLPRLSEHFSHKLRKKRKKTKQIQQWKLRNWNSFYRRKSRV